MAVRRLADDAVQPEAFAFNRANAAWAKRKLKDYPKGRQASAVIPLLMRAQDQDGWVTKSAIETIAEMLAMPFIRVLEVATFYTQFQLAPVGTRAHVQVCGTTPCMLRGAEDLKDVCRAKIHPEQHHPNAEGTMSWEEVECLGACVNAPMVMIFRDTYEDLDAERFADILDAFEAGQGDNVPVGPQVDRHRSAPQGGATTLLDDPTADRPHPHDGHAEDPAATEAARPDTHAPLANPALKTPVDRSKAKEAAKEADAETETLTADDIEGEGSDEGKRGTKTKPAGAKRKARASATKEKPPAEAPSAKAEGQHTRGGAPGDIKPMAALVGEAQGTPGQPPALERPAEPDDLKLIAGVGPKIEGTLNGLGIWTFAQIAAWTETEQSWIDGYLRFKGRIQRDDWVRQADALARGGRDEYVRVFGREPR